MEEIQFIEPGALHEEMKRFRMERKMDFLESLTGMDWGEGGGLGVVYHLGSTQTKESVTIKSAVKNRNNPEIHSVSDLWKGANFYEREVYDFFGIVFIGNPDMRRLFLRNDWVGYPLRKDNDPEKNNPLRMDNEES